MKRVAQRHQCILCNALTHAQIQHFHILVPTNIPAI